MSKNNMVTNGCVIFAKNVETLSVFYQSVLSMALAETSASHHVLSNGSVELVIHGIPEDIAKNISISDPPDLRISTAIKPVFVVASLEKVRQACEKTNGGLQPASNVWTFRGASVIDGWDPEGNVIQFKQVND